MKYIAQTDQTLIEALGELSPGSSKTSLRSWLKEGRVTIDGEISKLGNTFVRKGQEVFLGARPRFIPGDLRIYYEDSYLVVIEKPSGLLSVATHFEKGDTAHSLLKNYYRPKKVFVVHRLDQDTSGVMLFALNEAVYEQLKTDFEQHLIERSYTGVVEGYISPSNGTWRSYLYEDGNYVVHSTPNPQQGREAITHYRVQATAQKRSLLSLRLETGRKNQIRVHCQDAGHSIVGDKKYGSRTNPVKRLCLHAHLLSFTHPVTKQKLRFESPPPTVLTQLVQM